MLEDAKSVDNGGKKLITAINRELREYKDGKIEELGGHLYEAEVVSHLKRSGWKIDEVEKDIYKPNGQQLTEIDIIAEYNGEKVYIECKRSFDDIDVEQIENQVKYAKSQGVGAITIYYSNNPKRSPYYTLQMLREISSKYNIDIKLEQLTSSFN